MYSATEPAFVQELKQKPEYKIIHELLQQPDTDPNAAAEKIIDLTIEGIDNEQSSHYYDTACSVVEIARRTEPEHQDKLCKFVAALRLRPINHPRTGEPLLLSGTRVWTELPAFGYTFGDEIQGISGLSKRTQKEAQQDENLEAFLAKLTGCPPDTRVDFAFHGQIIITEAFQPEVVQIPPGHAVQTARLGCWWFIHAAATLWSKVQDPEDKDWCLDLWNSYKAGVCTAKATMRNHDVRKLIERALAHVEKAEQGGSQ